MFEFVQQNLLLVSVFLVSSAMLLWPMLLPGGQDISSTDATLKINRENAVVIDVRSSDEFSAGHVPSSINIPRDKLRDRVGELEKFKGRPLIVNCASGARAGGACGELRKLGFDNVFRLSGGMGSWVQAGLPLSKGAK